MSYKDDFHLFIGGKTGILKGVAVQEPILVKNLQDYKKLTKDSEITAMAWGDRTETDILIGTKEQTVKVYDTEFKSFTCSIQTKEGSGPIVGITRYDVLTTCSASGHIKVWKSSKDKAIHMTVGGDVEKMESSSVNSGILGTGGRNNDLKIWNLETTKSIFVAKNVRHNELNLAVPIWVSDLKFLTDSYSQVVTCSRYGHIRLYDTKSNQRRPIIDYTLPDQSLQCIALPCREHQVVVGSGTGYLLCVDFRMTGNDRVVGSFKGATGSIRQLACHTTKPYVVSVGLDNYFRIHNIETKALLKEKFMQVKLNAVLMRTNCNLRDDDSVQAENEVSESHEATTDMDSMFGTMDTIGGKRPRLSKT